MHRGDISVNSHSVPRLCPKDREKRKRMKFKTMAWAPEWVNRRVLCVGLCVCSQVFLCLISVFCWTNYTNKKHLRYKHTLSLEMVPNSPNWFDVHKPSIFTPPSFVSCKVELIYFPKLAASSGSLSDLESLSCCKQTSHSTSLLCVLRTTL